MHVDEISFEVRKRLYGVVSLRFINRMNDGDLRFRMNERCMYMYIVLADTPIKEYVKDSR